VTRRVDKIYINNGKGGTNANIRLGFLVNGIRYQSHHALVIALTHHIYPPLAYATGAQSHPGIYLFGTGVAATEQVLQGICLGVGFTGVQMNMVVEYVEY
jgi:hypothetical protein